ncbi:hypothetical protein [Exiguobacterium flavidum]|uniref:hypothetical protein n=1 Tax=Exiguobacterium flavidum TaxID=2184695 RepID=UPI000DF77F6D|nr:hypothetical protein [Exiguobacterium flavidum]
MRYMLVGIAAILFLSGCSTVLPHPAELLEHPSLPKRERSLKERITADLPKKAEIVAPERQHISRLYESIDLNGDGEREAVAFYREVGKGDFSIGLLVYEMEDGRWKMRERRSVGSGESLDQVNFIPHGKDGHVDILVGIRKQEDSTLYSISGVLKKIDISMIDTYRRLVVEDLDQDGNKDIAVLQEGRPYRIILHERSGDRWGRQEVKLDSRESDLFADSDLFEATGVDASRTPGLLVSYTRAAQMHLAVFRMTRGKLVPQSFGKQRKLVEPMYTFPKDVDRNGTIEYGHQYTPDGSEGNDGELPRITAYYTWSGKTVEPFFESGWELQQEHYIDLEYNFVMRFPAQWMTRETIKKKENRIRFVNRETGQTDFALEVIPKDSYVAVSGKRKIKEGTDYVYVIDAKKPYENYAANVALVE